MKKFWGKLIAGIVLIMFVVSSSLVIYRLDTRPRTTDAFLLANVAQITPQVSGKIISLKVRDNQYVRKGDILFLIDPVPYQLKLNATQAEYKIAESTLMRSTPLLGKGYTTAEQIDEQKAKRDAVLAKSALAQWELSNTTITAPFDGKVIGLNIAAGEFAAAGHPIFTLVDTSKWYALANFRETEVMNLKKGAPAKIYLMSAPQRLFHGHVTSISWGIASDNAMLSTGLTLVPKTMNWVRIAQRFPVRVLIDNPDQNLMRIGTSAVVVVQNDTPS